MKNLCFILLIALAFGCKDAIKNEVSEAIYSENTLEMNTNKIYSNNTNLIVNSKEDLAGIWINNDFKITSDEYYGKIILAFDKIEENKILGEIFINGHHFPFTIGLNQIDQKFSVDIHKPLKCEEFENLNLSISIGGDKLIGNIAILNKKSKIETFEIALQKKNFVFNIDNKIENKSYNYDVSGRDYSLTQSDFFLVEEIIVDEKQRDTMKTVKSVPKVEVSDYYGLTKVVFDINPSKKILNKSIVEDLSKNEIFVLRNLIFAKHGYIFKNVKLNNFFQQQSWYVPNRTYNLNDLSEIEKKNIDLLKRYEKNAIEYIRVFSR